MAATSLESILWWPERSSEMEATPLERSPDRAAGVLLHHIWLNHVGIVAHFSVRRLDESASEALAAMLRTIGDAARQVGRQAPLVAIVAPVGTVDGLTEGIQRLTRDQSWHRGDFVLRGIYEKESVESVVASLLLPFESVEAYRYQIRFDQPEETYLEEIRGRTLDGVNPLISPLVNAVSKGESEAKRAMDELHEKLMKMLEDAIDEARETDVSRREKTTEVEL